MVRESPELFPGRAGKPAGGALAAIGGGDAKSFELNAELPDIPCRAVADGRGTAAAKMNLEIRNPGRGFLSSQFQNLLKRG